MMFTSPMKLLTAVALDKDTDAIAQRLLESGAMDLVSVKDLSCEWKDKLAPLEARMSLAKLAELRKRVEGFMDMASPPISRPSLAENRESVYGVAARRDVDTDALSASLDALAADVNGLRERQKQLQDEILKLDEICRQLDAFDDLKAGAAASSTYSFLSIRAGILPQGSTERLEKALAGFPSVSLPSGQRRDGSSGVILISLKKDAARIEPALERLGWEDARLPDSSSEGKAEALRELAQKIDALRAGQGKCSDELKDYFRSKENFLRDSWAALRAEELVSRLRSSFARTDRTVLFSGWIPAEKAAQVEAGIRDAAKAGCVIEWIQPERDEAAELSPPVEMRNPGILKPFEGLVRNYAVPAYGSVDPTPFVALAYLMMFGLMFGDAGHGLVVALLGLGGIALARRKKKPDGLFRLVLYCGLSAVAAGVLFGSYFGLPLLPPLWFDYHGVVSGHGGAGGIRSIYDILGITIRFGMAVLGTGFVINWVNLVRRREWFTLLLDKGGIVGGWIYGAGAWAAFYFVAHDYKGLPPSSLLALMLGLPTLALAVKAPLEFALHGRANGKRFKPAMIMDFVMEWIVETLEIYSGYLANTLSFMRVAGLGIAHVSLMTAFFQIARMLSPSGGPTVASVAVLVFGNALVIALEGLSAGIQSLRLNYYEFFSRYFNGSGKAYKPISLGSED